MVDTGYIEDKLKVIIESEFRETRADGFFNGLSGYAYCLAKIENNDSHKKLINKIIRYVLERLNNAESYLLHKENIYDGLLGFCCVLHELKMLQILDPENSFDTQDLDEHFFEKAIEYLNNGCYDYLYGSFGFLKYFVVTQKKDYINRFLNHLNPLITKSEKTPFYHSSEILKGTHFGYAHGLPGTLKILSETNDPQAEKLIFESLDFMTDIIENNFEKFYDKRYFLPRANKQDQKSIINTWEASNNWSNSDLNFASMLYSLPQKFRKDNYMKNAENIILNSLERLDLKESLHNREDCRLFYGSAGTAKIYKKLINYGILKKEITPIYEYWIDKTYEFMKNENGQDDRSFLHGRIGAILCINEFEEKNDGSWDPYMLL